MEPFSGSIIVKMRSKGVFLACQRNKIWHKQRTTGEAKKPKMAENGPTVGNLMHCSKAGGTSIYVMPWIANSRTEFTTKGHSFVWYMNINQCEKVVRFDSICLNPIYQLKKKYPSKHQTVICTTGSAPSSPNSQKKNNSKCTYTTHMHKQWIKFKVAHAQKKSYGNK